MATEKKNKNLGFGTGLGMAAVAAAAAGAYYFYGDAKGGKRRRQLKSWAVKAKGDILEKMEQMQNISKDAYEAAVGQVIKKYEGVKTIDPKELADLGAELKNHWDKIASKLIKTPAAKKKPAVAKKRR